MANRNQTSPCNPAKKSRRYLIPANPTVPDQEGWFPLGEISLIGGSSGAGKTRWLIQMIFKWRSGEPVFRHPVCVGDFIYLSRDRSREGMERTLDRMNVDIAEMNFIDSSVAESLNVPKALDNLVRKRREMERKDPELRPLRLLVLEGIDFDVPEGKISDNDKVAQYVRRIRKIAKKHEVAVIATLGSPKMTPKNRYESPRDRLLGAGAWNRLAETVIVIEQEKGDEDARWVQVIPRNGKTERFRMVFKDGLLVESYTRPARVVALDWIRTQQPGFEFQLQHIELATSLNKTTASEALRKILEEQDSPIEKVKHGWYRVKANGGETVPNVAGATMEDHSAGTFTTEVAANVMVQGAAPEVAAVVAESEQFFLPPENATTP